MQTKKWILLLSAVTCLQLAISAQPFVGNDGKHIRKGHTVVTSEARIDTVMVIDPVTGEEKMVAKILGGTPEIINGKRIYYANEVTTPPKNNMGTQSLDEYIMKNIKSDIEKLQLPDGVLQVALKRIVIDETGKVVYYEYEGLQHWITNEGTRWIRDEKIAPKIHKLMASAPAMKPATLKGKNVGAYLSSGSLYEFKMEVKTRSKK